MVKYAPVWKDKAVWITAPGAPAVETGRNLRIGVARAGVVAAVDDACPYASLNNRAGAYGGIDLFLLDYGRGWVL